MIGLIVKSIAGFYFVTPEDETEKTFLCKARGIFKKQGIVPFVGDKVEFEPLDENEGIVNEILPRTNKFIRPPISNVDIFVVVMAAAEPTPNLLILDRFLIMAEQAHTDAVICLTKIDLDKKKKAYEIENIYKSIYPIVKLNTLEEEGFEELVKYLIGKKAAFAGPSGVGKSTLINKLQKGLELKTGDVSKKTKRGVHTTKHVEIFNMNYGGMAYDTPGFTSFEVESGGEEQLDWYYPEMKPFLGSCRFDNCKHVKEPNCSIKKAVKAGLIANSRYASYRNQLGESGKEKEYS